MKKLSGLVLLTFCAPVFCTQYESAHEMLVDVIEQGSAQGRLIGPIDELFSSQFDSRGALLVDGQVVKDLSAQCKRIALRLRKQDVSTPIGVTEAVWTMSLNYCLDGRPPSDEAGL